MKFNDVDWCAMMSSWSKEDVAYLHGISDASWLIDGQISKVQG